MPDNHIQTTALSGQVAVITAGSTGFGRAIAQSFAMQGAAVVIADLTEARAAGNFDEMPELSTTEWIVRDGGKAFFQTCDVRVEADVKSLFEATVARFGRLDILVNNAGVWRGGAPLHQLSVDDLEACLAVQVRGSWLCAQAAVRQFLHQGTGGNIINLVSTAGLRAHQGQAPYNLAKAAQASLTQCLAIEYASAGIRSNAICPTYVKTSMSRGGVESPVMGKAVPELIPLGRWGEISDVVNAARFLASPDASFMTGVLLPVDGGELLTGLLPWGGVQG